MFPMEAPKVAWYARRIFNPNASISCRPVESDLYIQQNIYLPEYYPSGWASCVSENKV